MRSSGDRVPGRLKPAPTYRAPGRLKPAPTYVPTGRLKPAPTYVGVVLLILVAAVLHAQSPDAQTTYQSLFAREEPLRQELAVPAARAVSSGALTRARGLIANYEAMAGKFPTSGYSDDALWHAAMLSADLYRQFKDAGDRRTAQRLFQELQRRFPSSTFARRAPAEIARLDRPATSVTPASTPAARPPARASGPSTLADIRREIVGNTLRITLVLDEQAAVTRQLIESPPRLVLDLANTRAQSGLRDATLTYADSVVRQVRIGSHDGDRTRVVLDLDGAERFSVTAARDPHRIVVELEPALVTAPALAPGLLADAAPEGTPLATTGVNTTVPPPLPPAGDSYSLSRQLGLGVARIVIDPGHGGHDPGARTRGLTEADIVLDVALKLERLLLHQQPGVEVILTRRTDTFVPLEQRTAIANREKADLFLSIHANASTNRNARGVETYFLNFAPNPEAEAIAARENASSAQTMRNLPEIVRAIALNNKIDESRDFARHVQASLYDQLRRTDAEVRNLGVKQAPFQVLIGATMPSILAEISFISHPEEGRLLGTEAYRAQIAEALLQGLLAYQQSLAKVPVLASQ